MTCPVPGPKVSVIHQVVARTGDALGGFTNSWANTETFDAVLLAKNNIVREAILYEKETVVAGHMLYCGAKKADTTARTITTDDRIKYGSRIFNIQFVDNIANQDIALQLTLKERDGD